MLLQKGDSQMIASSTLFVVIPVTTNKTSRPAGRYHIALVFLFLFLWRSDSSETLKPSTEVDPNQIHAEPTLAPRRAYSMEVVGKWTQIVRQHKVQLTLLKGCENVSNGGQSQYWEWLSVARILQPFHSVNSLLRTA